MRVAGRWLAAAGRRRWVVAVGASVAVGSLGVVPPLPALAFGAVAALSTNAAWGVVAGRVYRQGADSTSVLVAALADELRAGRSPPQALAGVAAHHAGPLADVLAEAARTEQLGGDTDAVFVSAAGRLPGGADLSRLATAWRLSRATGCSLADVLDAVTLDLRARRRQHRLLVGLLAGPRASAALLAGLPVIGLLMGAALGADPVRVLTSTGPGQWALVAGVGLDVAGILWTGRLVRAAGG